MATTKARPFVENGKKISRARRRAGVSQANLALRIGTTRRHMIRLENGEHLPGRKLRDLIAGECGVDRGEIQSVDDEDEESDVLSSMSTEELLRVLLARLPVPS